MVMDETKLSALGKEYVALQKIIDSFDTKSLTIKAWSVTVSMSGIGAAFISRSQLLFLLSSFSALIFWFLEYFWKTYQHSHFARIYELEKYFRNNEIEIELYQAASSWDKAFDRMSFKKKRTIFTWSNVMLPHFPIFITGIILYLLTT